MFDAAFGQIFAHEMAQMGQREANARSLYDLQVQNSDALKQNALDQTNMERQEAAVRKAQGLLQQDKDLDLSTLTKQEIEDIEAATGKSIGDVSLGDLDVAASNCASSLVGLAEAALAVQQSIAQ